MATLTDPRHIALFQLMQLRAALRLEAVGMKHSSGKSARKQVAALLSLKPRTPFPKLITALTAHIEAEKAKIKD